MLHGTPAFAAAEGTAAMRAWASGAHLPWHEVPAPRGSTRGAVGVTASDAHDRSRATLDLLESMAGGRRAVDPSLLALLARASLFDITTSERCSQF